MSEHVDMAAEALELKSGGHDRPILAVGVAGASCSGKSQLVRQVSAFLRGDVTSHMDLDGYHLHDREQRRRLGEYPESASSNDLGRATRDLARLMSGQAVEIPTYDHLHGRHGEPVRILPRPVVFVEGLHALMLNELCARELIQLGVFLYPDEHLRRGWKTRRDVEERGYLYPEVLDEIQRRQPFVREHIFPQARVADAVVLTVRERSRKHRRRLLLSSGLVRRFRSSDVLGRVLSARFRLQQTEFEGASYSEVRKVDFTGTVEAVNAALPKQISIMTPGDISNGTAYGRGYSHMVQGVVAVVVLRLCEGVRTWLSAK